MDKAEQLAKIDNEINELQRKLESLFRRRKPLSEAIRDEKLDNLFPDGKITIEKVMGLNWNEVEGEWYRKIDAFFYSRKIKHMGYYPDTGQVALQLSFDQNKPFEEQLGILEWLPFIKPINNRKIKNKKIIGIFESTLSQYAVYELSIESDTKIEILRTRHYHTEVEKEFDNIRDALKYVYDKHPYIRFGDKE